MLQSQVKSAKTFLKVWNKITVQCACVHTNFKKAKPESHYDVLGIPHTASEKEIKEAFIDLSKKYHPDANTSDKTLHDKFVKISAAYDILGNTSRRIIYDEGLNAGFRDDEETFRHKPGPSSTDNPSPKEEFYEHPNYYQDTEMRKKAAEFWHANTGYYPATGSSEGGRFNPAEERSARRIGLSVVLISLAVYTFVHQFLKTQFYVQKKRPREDNIQLWPKPAGRKRKRAEPDINKETELTEKHMAGPLLYVKQKELKT